MVIRKEFRVHLPLSVPEYQVAQLWSVAKASKENTGGGEGIEVIVNEPFTNEKYGSGQYTHKIYHLQSKVPAFIRLLAPKGSLEMHEKAWNAYPYCRTEISNSYMKDNFALIIETMHVEDDGQQENIHKLSPEELATRTVEHIDIAMDPIEERDYKVEEDPTKFHSEKTGRGPLGEGWQKTTKPLMCAYKLVTANFKWWGLQSRVENFIMKSERRLFTVFHRQLFCWIDQWYGLTMEDIRRIEDETKKELDKQRQEGEIRGMITK
ncbi:phosphatidylinositol transfer protein alpha isoform-like isoform X1 [Anneissia japonica]|uniref:phosphatidylinositol transfer protein alpha isoform-like isoform X1 n=1 Tax=Anneissia japonica TaxID=1529436 RepID=UPI001425834A|nr:phosphatidylinositol transfer protein alpha isoform-like isoform X1 [Anneissia japonica]